MTTIHESIYNKVEQLTHDFSTRDPILLAENMGILVQTFPTTTLLGSYVIMLNQPCIFYSSYISDELKNIIIAHELGHHCLHKRYSSEKFFKDINIFNPTECFEKEANIFAAHLLIDDAELFRSLKVCNWDRELAEHFNCCPELIHIKFYELQILDKLPSDIENIHINLPRADYLKHYRPDPPNNYTNL